MGGVIVVTGCAEDGLSWQIPKYEYRYTQVDRRAHELLADPLLFVQRTASQRGASGRVEDSCH